MASDDQAGAPRVYIFQSWEFTRDWQRGVAVTDPAVARRGFHWSLRLVPEERLSVNTAGFSP